MRLLLAEDDPRLGETLARGLREESYAVDLVRDGDLAVSRATGNAYDAIVLDVMMPRRDGFAACRELRRRGVHTPVLMLTARDAVGDRIAGLDSGADDYLAKPFDFGELLARLRALLRRRGEVLPAELTVGDLTVDTRARTARRAGRAIPLTAKEYNFLEYLVLHAGRVLSRADIVAHVWDENHDPASNAIEVYVKRLRRKVDDGAATPLIHTRRGAGYLLAAAPDGDGG